MASRGHRDASSTNCPEFGDQLNGGAFDNIELRGPLLTFMTHVNVIFDILESHAFQKYCVCLVFKALFELLIENGPRSEKE